MKDCPNFPGYAVTEDGHVFRTVRTHVHDRRVPYQMTPRYDSDGYLIVGRSMKVHRMVADAYILNPEGKPQVAHNNGIRDDNRVCNLRWATVSENLLDRRAHGTSAHPSRKLSSGGLAFARGMVAAGFSRAEVAPLFGVSRETLGKALRGATYVAC